MYHIATWEGLLHNNTTSKTSKLPKSNCCPWITPLTQSTNGGVFGLNFCSKFHFLHKQDAKRFTINIMTTFKQLKKWRWHDNDQPIDVKNIHTIYWTYYIHGVMMEMLAITYLCATSRKLGLMRNLVLAPSSTSPTFPSSSSTSHIHRFTTSNLCKYLVMDPKHPSRMYPSAIETSGLAILCTYNFKVFMYLSTRYIHLVATGPHISNLSTRWYN